MNYNRLLFADLSTRSVEPELMDFADCDCKRLFRTLRQFKTINKLFTGIRGLLQKKLLTHMEQYPSKEYTVLDLGSGGCDIPLWLAAACRRRSLNVKIICTDNDTRVVQYASEKCKKWENIKVVQCSAFNALSEFKSDYIMANHFLHHLPDSEIISLLRSISQQSKKGFLINDLRRSRFALWSFFALSFVLFHRSFLLTDGMISITKGFTPQQILFYLSRAGVCSSVEKVTPGHICIYHFKSGENGISIASQTL